MIAVAARLVVAGLLFGGAPPADRPRAASPAKDSADSVVAKVISHILKQQPDRIAALLHEPKSWAGARAEEDRRKVAGHLAVIFRELGRVRSPRSSSPALSYRLEVGGADNAYWQSLPNLGIASSATYLVNFEKAGPGVIGVTLTRASGPWEVASIAFGIDKEAPGSRATMVRIARVVLDHMLPGKSQYEIDAMVDAALGP